MAEVVQHIATQCSLQKCTLWCLHSIIIHFPWQHLWLMDEFKYTFSTCRIRAGWRQCTHYVINRQWMNNESIWNLNVRSPHHELCACMGGDARQANVWRKCWSAYLGVAAKQESLISQKAHKVVADCRLKMRYEGGINKTSMKQSLAWNETTKHPKM